MPNFSDSGTPPAIGPFRILRLLGVGGMGAVYLGERMEQFTQQVAIKILHPHLFPIGADAEMEREGQLLAALEHPGIVRMLDRGLHENGLRYIVMEYVDGIPLDRYCDDRQLPIRHRIEILMEVFAAVEYAHRHLVVHADLKPENILVTADGKPRLLDFGVATILSELGIAEAASLDLNQAGFDSGKYTLLYASPEQLAGERLTVASDIYTLGLIARSILAGIKPILLPIGVQHSAQLAFEPPASKRLRVLNGDLSRQIAETRITTVTGLIAAIQGDIDAILAKALRPDPKERFQSAQEMRDEFERYLLGYPIQIRPVGKVKRVYKWVRRNRLAAGLGGVFLFAALFSIAGVVKQTTEAAHKRQIAQTRLHELVRLTDLLAGELYESLHGLDGSTPAQTSLLNSAHQTIDRLSVDDGQDVQLDLELASEYDKLARLELSLTPLTSEAINRSAQDMEKEKRLLQHLNRKDPAVQRILERSTETIRILDAAIHKQPH